MVSSDAIAATNVHPEAAQSMMMQPMYDYDEGIKRYTKKIYSELIDIIQNTLPEGSNADNDDKNPEELKGYHSR